MAKGKPIRQVTPPTRARSGRPPTKGGAKRNISFDTQPVLRTKRLRRLGMQDYD